MTVTAVPSGLLERAKGAVIGQAIGDALGAPTENLSHAEIQRRHGWVDGYLADVPMGTDDTEYAVLTAWAMLRHGRRLTAEDVSELWRTHLLGQTGGFEGGGFSEHGAISNLRRGLVAPVTGSDNHERWSDGCAMRVVGIGVYCAGDPTEAARLTAIEGSVSHAGDGIRCGQVIAAGVAAAMTATDWAETVDAILDTVGDDSWTGRAVRRAAEIGTTASSLQDALAPLLEACAIPYYPWPDVAPEAVALAVGIFSAARGRFTDCVLGGANIGRDADTIAAMAGAMSGALNGVQVLPADWRDAVLTIRGRCITATAGTRLDRLAEELVTAGWEDR
jgi:ADP-ribosylglycohydrolase